MSFVKKILCIGAGFILWNNHSDNSTRNEDSIITKDILRTNNYLLSLFLCAVILFLSVNQLWGFEMYTTIEALYKDGKILPLKDNIKIKNGKVLITVLEDTRTNVVSESTLRDLLRNKNVVQQLNLWVLLGKESAPCVW